MAEVLSWQNLPDPRATLLQVAQALAEGQLVAFPTDTHYVLAASLAAPAAIERLLQHESFSPSSFAVAVGGLAQALELKPGLSPLAQRFARRCWPGPVTLLCPGTNEEDRARLPQLLRAPLAAQDELALCCPAHEAILYVVRELKTPLLLVPLGAAAQTAGDAAALVIDDGRCRYDQGSTVVRVGAGWELVREGAVPGAQLRLQAACAVIFVCTGNTCRSPLAEALCKKKLAERLGCAPAELPQRGFLILSAGVSAIDGDEAAASAIDVAREYGADLAQHSSQALHPQLATQADYLVCMTQSHRQTLLNYFSDLGCQPRLLSPEGIDLPDPVGQEEAVYRACAEQIWKDLDALVGELTA